MAKVLLSFESKEERQARRLRHRKEQSDFSLILLGNRVSILYSTPRRIANIGKGIERTARRAAKGMKPKRRGGA